MINQGKKIKIFECFWQFESEVWKFECYNYESKLMLIPISISVNILIILSNSRNGTQEVLIN